ncbi:MAG: DUF721 domain-containing protein [Bacteroidales bacterium]
MRHKETLHISEIIPGILKQQRIDVKLDETAVAGGWEGVVGSQMSSYTKSVYVRNGTLYVEMTSSVARGELSMSRNIIIDKLNGLTGHKTINNIVFR